MQNAIPVSNGRLSSHFGRCERFVMIDVDPISRTIIKQEEIAAHEHQPGLLPRWLRERGAQVVIPGGMGSRAQSLFTENNIKVVVGVSADTPEHLALAYLEGKLHVGENSCDY